MIIGIDARLLGPEQGGLGRYIQELITHLEKIDQTNNYVIFLRKQNWHSFEPTNKNFRKILADVPWYGIKEQLCLAKIIKKQKIYLMHFPHWNVPFFYNKPFVLTLHDLILLHFPNRNTSTHNIFLYKLKYLFFKIILVHAINKAKTILVPSNFVKEDLEKNFKVSSEKIIVTTEGTPEKKERQKNTSEILNKYSIKKPYILYVGAAYPHKNLNGLLEYHKIFQERYSNQYSLVLAGKKNYFYNQLAEVIKKEKIQNITLTDFVEDLDLPILYQEASVFVYPTLYEGFGLPPFEALANNTPVVVAKTSCLPEILGDAALYFDPHNKNEAADRLWQAVNDENLRKNLISNGEQRIKLYSWETCAQLSLQAYQNSV